MSLLLGNVIFSQANVVAAISQVKGKKFMKAFQLRKDARSTRVYCISCYSVLGIDHPSYDNNVFNSILFTCAHIRSKAVLMG